LHNTEQDTVTLVSLQFRPPREIAFFWQAISQLYTCLPVKSKISGFSIRSIDALKPPFEPTIHHEVSGCPSQSPAPSQIRNRSRRAPPALRRSRWHAREVRHPDRLAPGHGAHASLALACVCQGVSFTAKQPLKHSHRIHIARMSCICRTTARCSNFFSRNGSGAATSTSPPGADVRLANRVGRAPRHFQSRAWIRWLDQPHRTKKLDRLRSQLHASLGSAAFDYIGNDTPDLPLLAQAAQPMVANPTSASASGSGLKASSPHRSSLSTSRLCSLF